MTNYVPSGFAPERTVVPSFCIREPVSSVKLGYPTGGNRVESDRFSAINEAARALKMLSTAGEYNYSLCESASENQQVQQWCSGNTRAGEDCTTIA